MEILPLVAAGLVGAFATWQAMTIQQLKAELREQQRQLAEQAAQLAQSRRDVWEEVKQESGQRMRNVFLLQTVNARDALDIVNQMSPEAARRIVKELGIGKDK